MIIVARCVLHNIALEDNSCEEEKYLTAEIVIDYERNRHAMSFS